MNMSPIICSKCYHSLIYYFEFAATCLDWEEKLKKYLKMVGLRKKRKICLESFKQNLHKITELEGNEDQQVLTVHEDNFYMDYNDEEVNIKHELKQMKDNEYVLSC